MTPDVLSPAPLPPPAPARRRGERPAAAPAEPRLGIVGLGYVGLPTALAATAAGLEVIGLDTSRARLRRIRGGSVDLLDRDRARLDDALTGGALRLADDAHALRLADVVLVCVPTPVHADRTPDLRPLRAACAAVVEHARAGQTLVLTSTTSVGSTAELLVEPLAARGLVAGEDVHVAFSPERIDPGNVTTMQEDTPRVVGGATPACTRHAAAVLRSLTARVHEVSSMEAAELTKLYENTFRAVNIALAYEIADAASHYALDPIEVTEAAATKPYGFMPFYPGVGVGGHCIPCDPHYLLDPLATAGRAAPLIERAMDAIADRPDRVARRALELLGGAPQGRRVLVVGVTYKPGVQDVRESPALAVMAALEDAGCVVGYDDPLIPALSLHGRIVHAERRPRGADWDIAIACTLQPGIDLAYLDDVPLLLDGTYRAGTGHTV